MSVIKLQYGDRNKNLKYERRNPAKEAVTFKPSQDRRSVGQTKNKKKEKDKEKKEEERNNTRNRVLRDR